MLVLVGLVSLSLVLFGSHSAAGGGIPGGSGGTPVTAHADAGGLDFSLQMTARPYFLSELIVADLSLTNKSQTTFELAGPSEAGPCGAAVYLSMTGGTAPQYMFPVATGHSCPSMQTQLNPNHTLALQEFLPISSSGDLTLTAGAQFLRIIQTTNGGEEITNGPSPLDGHWPSMTISVASSVPPNRQIALWQEGTQIQVIAPAMAKTQLYYTYTVQCDAPGQGTALTGNFAWEPLATTLLQQPDCPDAGDYKLRWVFAVSAPGYAIASG